MAGFASSSDEERADLVAAPRPKTSKHWRWLGMSVAVVGTVGAVAAMNKTSKPPTAIQHLSKAQGALMAAFNSRALTETDAFQTNFEFLLQEEGKDDPSTMSIDAVITTGEEQPKGMGMKLVFNSQEGKAGDLVKKFQEIFDAGLGEVPEDQAPMFRHMVTIEEGAEDDTAEIKLKMPKPEDMEGEEEAEDALKDALKTGFKEMKPKFTASIKTGRSMQEMFDNIEDDVMTLPQGFQVKLDSTFAASMLKAWYSYGKDQEDDVNSEQLEALGVLTGLSKVSSTEEIRYKSSPEGAFEGLPTLSSSVEHLEDVLRHFPQAVVKAMGGLEDLADGVNSFAIRGLPHKFEITATFDNFHITPLLAKMLPELAEEPAEDAAEEAK